MTFPQQQGPRPGPPPGGFRPQPPLGAGPQPPAGGGARPPAGGGARRPVAESAGGTPEPAPVHVGDEPADGTGHPAVDAVLQSLANAARLAPGEQIAEYEAAHQVLQETLAGIDR
ncbi:hypothetical protein HH310_20110 [Actinoplanes sp. TBRC 11911]|uniref:hypothetical protein n=1 Tax=Actinoplanes sp. TBRC 11911 TaxID=2729386 RepID=UPI00145FA24C|nr:hypothetical protein [Actinoplanes sp. TBRC 11911]NMO53478.1 hypothetical protein [Actinoplanes sp. TBRC 11911]